MDDPKLMIVAVYQGLSTLAMQAICQGASVAEKKVWPVHSHPVSRAWRMEQHQMVQILFLSLLRATTVQNGNPWRSTSVATKSNVPVASHRHAEGGWMAFPVQNAQQARHGVERHVRSVPLWAFCFGFAVAWTSFDSDCRVIIILIYFPQIHSDSIFFGWILVATPDRTPNVSSPQRELIYFCFRYLFGLVFRSQGYPRNPALHK